MTDAAFGNLLAEILSNPSRAADTLGASLVADRADSGCGGDTRALRSRAVENERTANTDLGPDVGAASG